MEIVRLTEVGESELGDINTLLSELSRNKKVVDADVLSRVLASQDTEVWVAKENGRILGMATLFLIHRISGSVGHVDDVVVSPDTQGKGIGRALMEKIIERAKERGMRGLDLTSRPSRVAANALYQKLGFEKRETNPYRMKLE